MCDYAEREAAMVTIRRNDQQRPTVWCDPCLAPLIRALWDGGHPTVASCCGHGKSPTWVMLTNGKTLFLVDDEDRLVVEELAARRMAERAGASDE